jgi:hypothetical protein
MDVNTAAYRVVQIATGEKPNKSPVKSKAGKLGALARIKSLPKAKRKEIARKANKARWNKYKTAPQKGKGENGTSLS